ncbi:hypothetical protein [Streptomyces sp. NPDC058086]|uniref:hypothetical protein n=1 Tax=Streptomyces sp. NPDC058086 TaxID=3346334 RepID=UPI0036EDB66E
MRWWTGAWMVAGIVVLRHVGGWRIDGRAVRERLGRAVQQCADAHRVRSTVREPDRGEAVGSGHHALRFGGKQCRRARRGDRRSG